MVEEKHDSEGFSEKVDLQLEAGIIGGGFEDLILFFDYGFENKCWKGLLKDREVCRGRFGFGFVYDYR